MENIAHRPSFTSDRVFRHIISVIISSPPTILKMLRYYIAIPKNIHGSRGDRRSDHWLRTRFNSAKTANTCRFRLFLFSTVLCIYVLIYIYYNKKKKKTQVRRYNIYIGYLFFKMHAYSYMQIVANILQFHIVSDDDGNNII